MWHTYINATTLDDVLNALSEQGERARIIAGGTDLILELERGVRKGIDTLLDITRIPQLDQISMDEDNVLHLGPLVTHNHCVESKLIRERAYPLARAPWEVGAPQIRNRGTVAGNLISASPANDTIPPLMALRASVTLRSVKGTRTLPLKDFYTGVRKTVMRPDEMLVDISFPAMTSTQSGTFIKLALRRSQAISKVWDFNGTKLGGQPGEYPTVLGASIFYNKHEVVLDDHKGVINKPVAEALWNRCQELSDMTGIPHFIQILGEYGEAFESYFQWFDSIDNKTAFLMDSSVPAALAHACKYVTEVGLAHRAIYNSINGSIPPENIEAIKNSDVDAAIVLAFNPADPSVVGREKTLVEGGVAGQTKGMIQIAEEAGITRPILDTAATPLGIGSGGAYREILACKAIHGYPTGGAYHNMTVSWTWLKRWKGSKKNPQDKDGRTFDVIPQFILECHHLLYILQAGAPDVNTRIAGWYWVQWAKRIHGKHAKA